MNDSNRTSHAFNRPSLRIHGGTGGAGIRSTFTGASRTVLAGRPCRLNDARGPADVKLRARVICVLLGGLVLVSTAGAASLTVTSAGDSTNVDGLITLREALQSMNQGADINADVAAHRVGDYGADDTIAFSLPPAGTRISVTKPLPPIFVPLLVDGTTQPGYTDEPIVTLDGNGAGTARGLVVAANVASVAVRGLVVTFFTGDAVELGTLLFIDGFESGAATRNFVASGGIVLEYMNLVANGGNGITIGTAASVVVRDSTVVLNAGMGLDVRGGLVAERVEVGWSAGHGVRVESDEKVELAYCEIHNSGNHPDAPGTALDPFPDDLGGPVGGIEAGIFAVRETHADGLIVRFSYVRDNRWHGIILGHALHQSGDVFGWIEENYVFGNQIGIRVQQRDDTWARTTSTIVANNIVDNRGSGIYIYSSSQRVHHLWLRPIVKNSVSHNAMAGPGCLVAQAAPQVTFNGPVRMTPEQSAQCQGATDHEACESSSHCAWTGVACLPAYDMTGGSGLGDCATTMPNTITDYNTSDVNAHTVGVFATNAAIVNANFNRWRTADPFQNVGSSGLGFVRASTFCPSQTTCSQ